MSGSSTKRPKGRSGKTNLILFPPGFDSGGALMAFDSPAIIQAEERLEISLTWA